ncbi:MAG: aromatic amino acid transport family protein [Patescibacteria group bacterium]
MINFILAAATLIGTIIGVGMFGLPYAASQAGFKLTLIYLFLLGIIVTVVHLIYGEIVLRTKEKHRLPGYAQIYLGSLGKTLATFIFFTTLYLALLAYLLIGGEFLSIIFSGWFNFSATTGALILAGLGFGVVFKGLKLTGAFEFFMTSALIILIVGLSIFSLKSIDPANWNLKSSDIFLPYGLILFALAGGSAIPEIKGFFRTGRKNYLKWAIIIGTFIPVMVYAIFISVVLGVSGPATSTEAVKGLLPYFGPILVKYAALIGFLAVITSFFTVGLNIKNSLFFDFKFPRALSFLLTAGAPLILFFSGFKNFINILSFSGAILGGLEGILLILIWRQARRRSTQTPEYSLKLGTGLQLTLALVFLAGIVYEVMYYF